MTKNFQFSIFNFHPKSTCFSKAVQFPKQRQRGITLIELIIYMGIFSTLLMVLVQLFGTIINVSLEAQSTSAVAQDGRYILNRITYDVRRASAITSPVVGTPGSTLILTINGNPYTYTITNNNLTLDDGSGPQHINSEGTTVAAHGNLFTQLKSTNTTGTISKTVTISFTLTSTATREGKGNEVKSFQTTVGTR
jgi:Tfp pilus assembly protein PilW